MATRSPRPSAARTAAAASAAVSSTAMAPAAEVHGRAPAGVSWMQSVGLPDEGVDAYRAHYVHVCPRIPAMMTSRPGDLLYDYLHGSEEEMRRSEFYEDFLAPAGLRYYLAATLRNDEQASAFVGVHRTPGQGHVGQREMRLAKMLLPHFRNALRVHARLSEARTMERNLADVLHLSGVAFLLLDDAGVVWLNRRAEEIVRRHSAIGLRRGRLQPTSHPQAAQLEGLVRRARSAGVDGLRGAGSMLIGSPGADAPPLSVLVVPLARHAEPPPGPFGRRAHVLVTLSEPHEWHATPSRILRGLYGLTPAEARLASGLSGGASLADYAEAHGLQLTTVRTHFARLRHKLGCRDQADVMRVLLRLFPRLTDGDARTY